MLTPHSVESLKGIQKWGKWVGYLSIIFGALSALSGVLFFIVGAVPGIMVILFGVATLNAAKNAEKLVIGYDENAINSLFEHYRKSLKFYGVYYILSLAILLLVILFYGAIFFAMLSGASFY